MVDSTLSVTTSTLSVAESAFPMVASASSVMDLTLSVTEPAFPVVAPASSVADSTLSVGLQVDCEAEDTVFVAYLPISGRPWAFSKTHPTQNTIQTHLTLWHKFLSLGSTAMA